MNDDKAEDIVNNPRSWIAWKRSSEMWETDSKHWHGEAQLWKKRTTLMTLLLLANILAFYVLLRMLLTT